MLAVDDDESIREALARLLAAAGFEPTSYASAEELLSEVRARGWRRPFILITAHDAAGRREEALRHGAAAYLVKPFRGTALLTAIAAAVPAGGRS